jgi:tetratricopeptide (TPR) repeat protein
MIWKVHIFAISLRGELKKCKMSTINIESFSQVRDKISELIQNQYWVEAYSHLLHIKNATSPLLEKNSYSLEECDFLFRIYYNLFISSWNAKATDNDALEFANIASQFTERRDCLHLLYYQMTVHAIQKGKLDNASCYIAKALEYSDNAEQKAYSYKYSAVLSLKKHQPNDALTQYMEAAYYAEEAHMSSYIPFIYIELVDVWYELEKPEIALNIAEQAVQLSQKSGQYNTFIRAKVKKAQLLYKLGRDIDAKNEVLDVEFAID